MSKLKQKTDGSGSWFSKSGSSKKAVSIRIQERVGPVSAHLLQGDRYSQLLSGARGWEYF